MLQTLSSTMSDQALADELASLLATHTRSLVRHVLGEAKPYVSPRTYAVWTRLQGLAHENDEQAARLSHLIDRLELPPRTVPYDTTVSFYHYVTVEKLLPELIAEKESQVRSYQTAIEHARAYPDAVAELDDLLAQTRRQLELLKADWQQIAGK